MEFGDEEYKEIDDYCKKIGIEWFASAWDLNSQKFLRKFNCKFNKVASAMLGNIPLVKMIAEEEKNLISTMSTLEEIEKVVKIFKDNDCPFELMHCK